MRVCVLSGKGGAGKTLVAVNLAHSVDEARYIDCDIEEPNGAIFLKPRIVHTQWVNVKIPQRIEDKCKGCRKCVDFCQFHALAFVKNSVMIFPELCHSCGGCVKVCPTGALRETDRCIGTVEKGKAGNTSFAHGILSQGEPSGVPIIKHLLADVQDEGPVIIDCPPGSACTAMESMEGCDFCLLVAEPTLFGVHNLKMVYGLTKVFSIPCGVVINKAVPGNEVARRFCKQYDIPVLMEVPYEKRIAKLSSEGEMISEKIPQYRQKFAALYSAMQEVAGDETISHSQR